MKTSHLLAGLAAIALAAIAYVLTRPAAPADGPPAPSATVSAIPITQRSVELHVSAWGSVVAGQAETNIAMAAPGVITGVLVHPGQAVTAGQALAVVAPDPQSIADLRKAEDAARAAQAQRGHVAALLQQHLATTADLAAATQALDDATAALAALHNAGTGENQTIRAPFAGIVTAITAAQGGVQPAGTAVLKLAAAGGLTVLVGLPEADALRVRPGDAATVSLLNTGAQLPATVAQRAAMLDPQTGLVDVTLALRDTAPLGEPVGVTITTGTVTGYPVPRGAVLNDEQGDYVYQLDTHNVAHREAVHVLDAEGGTVVLAPTLDPAMKLATTGAYQLSDGMTATLQGAGN
ncbi:efflux RND transporter periplasmic adaptor subunit [Acidocella aromatica]|uniref:RND family efflux transporter MFP subunit n=1 Tax=Acidocella aromatica TaxID=1303579 RepID=A0A840VLL4_9PROT|nr:efflux RND transporter periplasmic adaptor subunit [Acidocella aromatica]MBB5373089.1 RND family efflux transporter MFP subunit [Acidocella aromatica]